MSAHKASSYGSAAVVHRSSGYRSDQKPPRHPDLVGSPLTRGAARAPESYSRRNGRTTKSERSGAPVSHRIALPCRHWRRSRWKRLRTERVVPRRTSAAEQNTSDLRNVRAWHLDRKINRPGAKPQILSPQEGLSLCAAHNVGATL